MGVPLRALQPGPSPAQTHGTLAVVVKLALYELKNEGRFPNC